MDESYLGCVLPWALSYAPDGWAFCNGQTMQIQGNQALYSILGTAFGGNGQTTFLLPNLTGRLIRGMNYAGADVRGAVGGAKSVTLSVANLPQHNHSLGALTGTMPTTLASATTTPTPTITTHPIPVANDKFAVTAPTKVYAPPGATANTAIAGLTVTTTSAISTTGSAAALPVLPPYQALTFIICIAGIYPNRW
ncbi:MAG: tail fiber protein [Rhodospirillaceae bacterium]|nr:tail fiber protein [Rhodospirillales bacterium]